MQCHSHHTYHCWSSMRNMVFFNGINKCWQHGLSSLSQLRIFSRINLHSMTSSSFPLPVKLFGLSTGYLTTYVEPPHLGHSSQTFIRVWGEDSRAKWHRVTYRTRHALSNWTIVTNYRGIVHDPAPASDVILTMHFPDRNNKAHVHSLLPTAFQLNRDGIPAVEKWSKNA